MAYKNPELRRAAYLKNKEAAIQKAKDYYQANKEKQKSLAKKYRETHKKEISNVQKVWYQATKPTRLIQKQKHYENNKEKYEAKDAKRRLLLANAEASMTEAEKKNYQELVLIRDAATQSTGYDWSIDHIIPVSKGGTNAINNLEVVPLSWNISKGNRNTESFWGTA